VEGLEFWGFDSCDHLLAFVADIEDGKGVSHHELLVLDRAVAVESEKLGDTVDGQSHSALLDVADGGGTDADFGSRPAHGDPAGSSHPAENDEFAGDPLGVTSGRVGRSFSRNFGMIFNFHKRCLSCFWLRRRTFFVSQPCSIGSGRLSVVDMVMDEFERHPKV
jgi:hypothetical protein